MTLLPLVLAASATLMGWRSAPARLTDWASATATVSAGERLPFDGPARHEATALLLTALVRFESDFRADVERCERDTPALGLFQIEGLRDCPANLDAARLAVGKLNAARRGHAQGIRGLVVAYMGQGLNGKTPIVRTRTRERIAAFRRLCSRAGVAVVGLRASFIRR